MGISRYALRLRKLARGCSGIAPLGQNSKGPGQLHNGSGVAINHKHMSAAVQDYARRVVRAARRHSQTIPGCEQLAGGRDLDDGVGLSIAIDSALGIDSNKASHLKLVQEHVLGLRSGNRTRRERARNPARFGRAQYQDENQQKACHLGSLEIGMLRRESDVHRTLTVMLTMPPPGA